MTPPRGKVRDQILAAVYRHLRDTRHLDTKAFLIEIDQILDQLVEAAPSRVNRVTVHTGAVKQASRLLQWWADDASDDPRVLEMIQQSKEVVLDFARDLQRQRV